MPNESGALFHLPGAGPKPGVRNVVHPLNQTPTLLTQRKPLEWWADALDVLRGCPEAVKKRVGFALDEAQLGGKSDSAKPVPSVGSGVYAIKTNHDTETYRTFYVARFPEAVYAFYVVHKKATKGIDLPQHQKRLAAKRYKEIVDWRISEGLG